MADRITQTQQPRRRGWVVPLFLLRYFLAGIAGYLLYRMAPDSVRGFLAGLFLPVAAIFVEAGYEVYVSIVRGV